MKIDPTMKKGDDRRHRNGYSSVKNQFNLLMTHSSRINYLSVAYTNPLTLG